MEAPQSGLGHGRPILHGSQQPRQGPTVAGKGGFAELIRPIRGSGLRGSGLRGSGLRGSGLRGSGLRGSGLVYRADASLGHAGRS